MKRSDKQDLKKAYLKRYDKQIKAGNKNTPTYYEYANASETERGLMSAGINKKERSKLKRSKK